MTAAVRCPVVELRQYSLHPGQREALITLFDRELVESQERTGITVLGQFRDLDNPDRFVWLRGFDTMPARAEALAAFYNGPIWMANRAAANVTMVDSDNVLLLRPSSPGSGFPAPDGVRPGPHQPPAAAPSSVYLATIYHRDRPFDDEFLHFFDSQVHPAAVAGGAPPLACLQTEYAENTFPALPVRTGEHVFAWFARFADPAQAQACATGSPRPPGRLASALTHLRLTPTARSRLR